MLIPFCLRFPKSRDLLAWLQTKEQPFQTKACGEFAKLRTVQEELEREAQQACFLGCSVTETGVPHVRNTCPDFKMLLLP